MNILAKKLKNMTSADFTAVAVIGGIFLFMWIFSVYDGTVSDEAFYSSIVFRLMNGDGLFTDEWHLSQLSSVLLYIPVRLFYTLTGSFAGLMLFLRRIFCLMQLTGAVCIYKVLKKTGAPSIIFAAGFMIISVIGIRSLSYNTMGLFLIVMLILTAYSLLEKPSYPKMLLSGALIAMFILCQPVAVILYAVYFVSFLVIFISFRTKKKEVPFPFTIKAFSLTVIGILPVFIFFLFVLLSNSDIETVIRCIPGVLTDIEHMLISVETGIETFSVVQYFKDMTSAAGVFPLILTALTFLAVPFVKKYNKNVAVIFTLSVFAIFTFTYLFRYLTRDASSDTDDANFFYLPLALFGPMFYILCDRKNHRAFILFWCTGMTYSVFMTVSSNLMLHASINGYIVAAAGSLIIAKDLLSEFNLQEEKTKFVKAAGILITVLIFGFTAFNCTLHLGNMIISRASSRTATMSTGLYAGIKLPSEEALLCTRIYNDAQKIKEKTDENDRIFVLENIPLMYLESERSIGCPSGWFFADQLSNYLVRNRYREYYEIFPENMPDYIYVPAYTYSENGLIVEASAKGMAEFAYTLFEGEAEDIGSGLLITVTGFKNETE